MTEKFKRGKVKLNGKVYTKLKDIAEDYNIDTYVLTKRVRRGFTLEQAVDKDFRFKYGYSLAGKSVKFKGVMHKSLSALSKHIGIEYKTTKRFLEKGYSLEYLLKMKRMLGIEFNGKVYNSKKQLAEEYGIDYRTFMSRLNMGWSIEKALVTEKGKSKYRGEIKYKGKVYKTYKDLAIDYNILPVTLSSRLNSGMSLDEALTPLNNHKNFTIEGKFFSNIKKAAEYLGVNKSLLYNELKMGKSLDDVVGSRLRNEVKKGRKNRYKNIQFNGKTFDNLKQLSEYSGVEYSKLYRWVSKGLSEYELGLKIFGDKTSKNLRNSKPVNVNGVKFSSLREVSVHYSIPYSRLHFRLSQGYSIEQAIDPDFRKKYAYKKNK